jgi:hypothetical protein
MSRTLVAASRVIAPREPFDSDIEEAREALEFWSMRAQRLPWYRRSARREADAMATRWRTRLVAAHLDRRGLRRIGPAVQALLGVRPRRFRSIVWLAVWRTPLRRFVAAVAVAGIVMMAAVATTVVLLLLPAAGM